MIAHWPRYAPSARQPWNVRRVHHLHRSAGFGATWSEIERDLARGPEESIEAVLRGGEPRLPKWEERLRSVRSSAVSSNAPPQLQAWWVLRMMFGGYPLRERLTLLWHDHFATSQLKVRNLALMAEQNELFYDHGQGPFGPLLTRVVKHPALLVYLDAPANRKGNINENLGRELLELFTLGVGHYSQEDVVQASRALTGWGVARQEFRFRPEDHDGGKKHILGSRGAFSGDDLLALTLAHPATPRRLASILCREFLGEGTPNVAVAALAKEMAARDLDVGFAVSTILHSERFHHDGGLGKRFVGPVEFALSAVRALEREQERPSTQELAVWIKRMGQELFFPPNVGGWQQGRGWFTQHAILARIKFAEALVQGRVRGLDGTLPLQAPDRFRERAANTFLAPLLVGHEDLGFGPSDPKETSASAAIRILSSPHAWLV